MSDEEKRIRAIAMRYWNEDESPSEEDIEEMVHYILNHPELFKGATAQMSNTKTFNYTNAYGIPKRLEVKPNPENDKFHVIMWDMRHGEFCGTADMTREEINEYLEHYNVTDRL